MAQQPHMWRKIRVFPHEPLFVGGDGCTRRGRGRAARDKIGQRLEYLLVLRGHVGCVKPVFCRPTRQCVAGQTVQFGMFAKGAVDGVDGTGRLHDPQLAQNLVVGFQGHDLRVIASQSLFECGNALGGTDRLDASFLQ